MGGRGSGGARVGSGQKPRDPVTVPGKPPEVPVELLPPPADLTPDQAGVWNELAPHACSARTLVRATVASFSDLCEAIVLKRKLMKQIEEDGYTFQKVTVDGSGQEHSETKAHPLLAQHRGMMQRVEAGLLRFKLAPMGKPIEHSKAPESKWDGLVN